MGDAGEFLALERAIAPFAEGFSVRSGNEGGLSGVYLYKQGAGKQGAGQELGVFAGLLLDAKSWKHLARVEPPEALVMAYVRPKRGSARAELVDDEDGIFQVAHATLMPLASPEPFELFDGETGALVRRRRLPEGAANLSDRRLLEFCRGSLALLGQVDLLETLRTYEIAGG